MDPLHDEFWSRESFNWADDVEEAIDNTSQIVVTSQHAVSPERPSLFSKVWTTFGSIMDYFPIVYDPEDLQFAEDQEGIPKEVQETSTIGPGPPVLPSVLDLVPKDVFRYDNWNSVKQQCVSVAEARQMCFIKPQLSVRSPVKNDSYDDLLCPDSFDWADESEELVATGPQNELNKPTEALQQSKEVATPTECVDYALGEMHEYAESVNNDTKSDEEEMQFLQSDEFSHATDEYNWRTMIERTDGTIHHWNWLGNPVYEPTATPPAESLAFMQAVPKAPMGRDRHRVNSILNRAMELIDPVLVKVDGENEKILELHGSELIRACDGRVSTLYSLHGQWMHQPNGNEHNVIPDLGGCSGFVGSSDYAVGNGIFGNRLINRNDWREWQMEVIATNKASGDLPRKLTWERPPPSSLANFESFSEATETEPGKRQFPAFLFDLLGFAKRLLEKTWGLVKLLFRAL